MLHSHTLYKVPLTVDGHKILVTVEVDYSYHETSPETLPSPGELAGVEIEHAWVDVNDSPVDFYEYLNLGSLERRLLEEISEEHRREA